MTFSQEKLNQQQMSNPNVIFLVCENFKFQKQGFLSVMWNDDFNVKWRFSKHLSEKLNRLQSILIHKQKIEQK